VTETQVITAGEVTQAKTERRKLIAIFADRLGLEPNRMMAVLKATAFRGDVSDEQMAALLIVANEHGLNPFTKELHAFPTKGGGIVPVVGVDGWARIVNEHPQFNGMEFTYDKDAQPHDKAMKGAYTCTIYRRDREHPTTITEYMDECFKQTDPWKSHPLRMLRHKSMIQCARLAFSFAGIYDPDEAERVLAAEDAIDVTPVKISPKKLREIVEGMQKAVEAKDRAALQTIYNGLSNEEQLFVWENLRSWERTAIKGLLANKALPAGIDLDAWSVTTLNTAKDGVDLLASYNAIEGAYADKDMEVPLDIQTLFGDLKQSLGVPG
jgi:phage recombination protein Bet